MSTPQVVFIIIFMGELNKQAPDQIVINLGMQGAEEAEEAEEAGGE